MKNSQNVFYPKLAEASAAAITIGITRFREYSEKHLLDHQLPARPDIVYKEEWQGWPSFLGKESKKHYPSLAEASAAAIALGIKSVTEYNKKRFLDQKLPASPDRTYKKEWQGWPSFLGKEPKNHYLTLAEASTSAIALGITTMCEYKARRHLDPQLPSAPYKTYKEEWQGFPSFLGRDSKKLYPSLAEASAAATALGITGFREYEKRCHLDPQLPAHPSRVYKEEWPDRTSFLGNEPKNLYLTLE